MKHVDGRLLMATGLSVFSASCFMNLQLDTNYAAPQLLIPDVTRAFGQALVMTPLAAIAMVGIAQNEAGGASGLFNMLRNLGGAVGTATMETFLTKREQYHSFIINAHVSLLQPATREKLAGLQQHFLTYGYADQPGAMHRAIVAVGQDIRSQATIMGYADRFALLGVILALATLSVAMLKRHAAAGGGAH